MTPEPVLTAAPVKFLDVAALVYWSKYLSNGGQHEGLLMHASRRLF
jgi:hypothetical protein